MSAQRSSHTFILHLMRSRFFSLNSIKLTNNSYIKAHKFLQFIKLLSSHHIEATHSGGQTRWRERKKPAKDCWCAATSQRRLMCVVMSVFDHNEPKPKLSRVISTHNSRRCRLCCAAMFPAQLRGQQKRAKKDIEFTRNCYWLTELYQLTRSQCECRMQT